MIPVLYFVAAAAGAQVPRYGLEVVATYPHDPGAFTQGLVWADGGFYESLGRYGQSCLRRVALETGAVLAQNDLPARYFAEGLARVDERLIQLTWKAGRGFVYGVADLAPTDHFEYPGQGWGLTYDGERLIMSDGSAQLRFLDPANYEQTGQITVAYKGRPVTGLNELEMVGGEVWANVRPTDLILRIDPDTGAVVGIIHAQSLRRHLPAGFKLGVLNGIAYDAAHERLFVTGKLWPRLFQVSVVPR